MQPNMERLFSAETRRSSFDILHSNEDKFAFFLPNRFIFFFYIPLQTKDTQLLFSSSTHTSLLHEYPQGKLEQSSTYS